MEAEVLEADLGLRFVFPPVQVKVVASLDDCCLVRVYLCGEILHFIVLACDGGVAVDFEVTGRASAAHDGQLVG